MRIIFSSQHEKTATENDFRTAGRRETKKWFFALPPIVG
jgi:hypothetical protein